MKCVKSRKKQYCKKTRHSEERSDVGIRILKAANISQGR